MVAILAIFCSHKEPVLRVLERWWALERLLWQRLNIFDTSTALCVGRERGCCGLQGPLHAISLLTPPWKPPKRCWNTGQWRKKYREYRHQGSTTSAASTWQPTLFPPLTYVEEAGGNGRILLLHHKHANVEGYDRIGRRDHAGRTGFVWTLACLRREAGQGI